MTYSKRLQAQSAAFNATLAKFALAPEQETGDGSLDFDGSQYAFEFNEEEQSFYDEVYEKFMNDGGVVQDGQS